MLIKVFVNSFHVKEFRKFLSYTKNKMKKRREKKKNETVHWHCVTFPHRCAVGIVFSQNITLRGKNVTLLQNTTFSFKGL